MFVRDVGSTPRVVSSQVEARECRAVVAVVPATPSGPGSRIDTGTLKALNGRSTLILLPAVGVLLPDVADAHAEVGEHGALDEDRRLVGVASS